MAVILESATTRVPSDPLEFSKLEVYISMSINNKENSYSICFVEKLLCRVITAHSLVAYLLSHNIFQQQQRAPGTCA